MVLWRRICAAFLYTIKIKVNFQKDCLTIVTFSDNIINTKTSQKNQKEGYKK